MMGGLRRSGDDPAAALRMVAPGAEWASSIGFLSRTAYRPGSAQARADHYISESSPHRIHRGLNWYRNFDRNWEIIPEPADATINVPTCLSAVPPIRC